MYVASLRSASCLRSRDEKRSSLAVDTVVAVVAVVVLVDVPVVPAEDTEPVLFSVAELVVPVALSVLLFVVPVELLVLLFELLPAVLSVVVELVTLVFTMLLCVDVFAAHPPRIAVVSKSVATDIAKMFFFIMNSSLS